MINKKKIAQLCALIFVPNSYYVYDTYYRISGTDGREQIIGFIQAITWEMIGWLIFEGSVY